MKLDLTEGEIATLKESVECQIGADTDVLKDHDYFSHGDWLRFENGLKNLKSIKSKLLKLKAKNGSKKA